ncbi:MAG: diacylglycerol kinase family protein [Ruminococcaceae bacterium]|nr:diacylglycerol kinase family protein [Oscillospiraceae bacterium]
MEKYFVFYNPLSNNKRGEEETKAIEKLLPGAEISYGDMVEISDMGEFLEGLDKDCKVVVSGGDGTISNFVNRISDVELQHEVYYFATGTGNDFLTDIGGAKGSELVLVNKYIQNLPVAEVKGKKYKFLNNVGFGIDGYCCEIGDKKRAAGKKKINYTTIAIGGLLGGYKRVKAKVTVDGVTRNYKNVWLAPTMNGRFVGGGMMACPEQDRLCDDGKVSLMVMHHPSKLKTLTVFPSIFKGEHVKHTEMVEQFKGYEVEVEFDLPTALQIDGETISGVTSYKVWASPECRKASLEELEAVK